MAKILSASALVFLLLAASAWPALAAWPSVADASALPTFRQLNQDERVSTLRAVLDDYGSPLADSAKDFVSYADKYQLDWKLVAAIAGVESTFGKHVPSNSFNAWGWAVFTGQQSGATFRSWERGIALVSQGIREKYLNDGLTSVEQIGRRYASSRAWPNSVRFFIAKIEGFTPTSSRTLPVEL
jgi:hypothetical protein